MIGSPLTLVLLAVAGGGALLALEQAIRRTELGFALLVLTVVLDSLLFDVNLQLAVGPFSLYPNDLVFGLLGVAAVARLLRSQRVHPMQMLVLIYLALLIWSALRGVPLHGAATALNEARKNFTYCGALLYFSTMSPEDDRPDRFLRWWIGLGAYLLVVAVGRWLAFFAGLHRFLPQGDTLRVIDSFDTVVLVTGFLLAAGPILRDRSGPDRLLPRRVPVRFELFLVASFLAIVLLQHRTLWIGLVLGITLLSARDPRLTGRLLVATLIGGALLSIAVIAVFGQGVERIVTDDLSSSATRAETFEWRLEGWAVLLRTAGPETAEELLVGQPFGGGFERYIDGHRITVSPHNYLLENLLRTGVAGVAVFVLLHALVIARLYRRTERIGALRPDVLAIAIVVLFLYYLTSHPHPEHGALTGFAVAVAMHAPPSGRYARRPAGPVRGLVPA